MNKTVKDALAKGKAMRDELDKKAAQKAKEAKVAAKAEIAKREKAFKEEAEYYLKYLPENLAKAVAARKSSFSIFTCAADDENNRYGVIKKLLEPEIKKMGLILTESTSVSWVQVRYDPDYGYDQTYYHLDVVVPKEEK